MKVKDMMEILKTMDSDADVVVEYETKYGTISQNIINIENDYIYNEATNENIKTVFIII